MKNIQKTLTRLSILLATVVAVAAPISAHEPGYIYVRNNTNSDLTVYIDGYEQTVLYKGYYEWYQTTAGHHKVETRRPTDPYHYSKHLVGCNPRGQIWVEETDFY